MFCKNCGKEIDDNALICPNCGVATEKMAQQTAATSAPVQQQPLKTNIFAIVGFVLSLAGGVVSYIPAVGSYLSFVVWIAALVLSIIGIKKAKQGYNLRGLAIAGLVFCILDVFLIIFGLLILFGLLAGFASML